MEFGIKMEMEFKIWDGMEWNGNSIPFKQVASTSNSSLYSDLSGIITHINHRGYWLDFTIGNNHYINLLIIRCNIVISFKVLDLNTLVSFEAIG